MGEGEIKVAKRAEARREDSSTKMRATFPCFFDDLRKCFLKNFKKSRNLEKLSATASKRRPFLLLEVVFVKIEYRIGTVAVFLRRFVELSVV